MVFGDDRVGMLRAVARDVIHRLVDAVDHPHGEDGREIFGVPIFFGRRLDAGHELARCLVPAQFDALVLIDFPEPRQHAIGDAARNEQRFHRVAGPEALSLGVVRDADGLVDVRLVVDIDVTHAVQMLDHRNARFLHYALDQAFAAARDDDVDVFVHAQQFADRGTIGGFDDLHRHFRQACRREPGVHALRDCLIRMQRFRAAAQDAGVARFQA